MCGITGTFSYNRCGAEDLKYVRSAVEALRFRGPDGQGIYNDDQVIFGHSRLKVIDVSDNAAQPFTDITGRYTIVFNGEFYNFREHREQLAAKGVHFRSSGDTEVLLYLFIQDGIDFLKKVNGCFSIGIYDKLEKKLLLARDRFGINPLYYFADERRVVFASEMKAMLCYGIDRKLDYSSLLTYLQLNYIPGNESILENIYRLEPGAYIEISNNGLHKDRYYEIPYNQGMHDEISYEDAKGKLLDLLDSAVKKRMVSDVPLGAFLSGGIDSSVIVSLASRHTEKLNTFSIGYRDEPFFDETRYAEMVAAKYRTNHTTFKLSNDDLYGHLHNVLEYLDEPFADSSALPVYILSKHTRQKATVALSGDGADELFGGYNKHAAHLKAMDPGITGSIAKSGKWMLKAMPKSRKSGFSNKMRQAERFAEGLRLNDKERYWRWCSVCSEINAIEMLQMTPELKQYEERKGRILNRIVDSASICDILYTDMKLVLPGDMLTKVDLMSMANSLEVRTPFLDHEIVNFVVNLPGNFRIRKDIRKRLLQDTFRGILPEELYMRPKKGFEVPLEKWLKSDLQELINRDLLARDFIIEQGIFHWENVEKLLNRFMTNDSGDSAAQIWGLVVFQSWWKKYFHLSTKCPY